MGDWAIIVASTRSNLAGITVLHISTKHMKNLFKCFGKIINNQCDIADNFVSKA